MSNSGLTVQEYNGALVVDSRLIAEQLEIQHKNVLGTVDKYLTEMQAFGVVTFQTEKPLEGSAGGRPEKFAYLNEDQATLLMTFSRNTPQVVACKVGLVSAFKKAKEIIKTVIPAQNDRLRELELELQVEKMRHANNALLSSMATMHGADVALALTGKTDQIVVSEKPTIEVINEATTARFEGQTLKQIAEYLQQHHGIKVKSGAEVSRALIRVGRADLIDKFQRPVPVDGVRKENLEEVYQILANGDRQRLIGE